MSAKTWVLPAWRFSILGLLLFILSAMGLYCQVQYLKMTEAPHLRAAYAVQKPSLKTKTFVDLPNEPGNAFEEYQCMGWRQTGACDPDGEREPQNDKGCDDLIQGGLSGYCEYYNPITNETMHVLKMTCNTVRGDVHFSCNMATDILMFHRHGDVYRHPWNMQGDPKLREYIRHEDYVPVVQNTYPVAKNYWYDQGVDTSSNPENGIVMVAYGKALVSLYATVQYLRKDLLSELPIEIWYREDELKLTNPVLVALTAMSGVTLREIQDPLAVGFYVKPYVIFFSNFRNILFLDADNLPVKDPSYLFDTPEFKSTGAVFWPDFWHPGWTIFNVHENSLMWPMLNMEFADMFEQESGQLLIDRARCEKALHMLMYYTFHRIKPQPATPTPEPDPNNPNDKPPHLPTNPNLITGLKLVWGDKDLFRLAWLKTKTPFHMISHPPGALGLFGKPHQITEEGKVLEELDETKEDRFCGKSMVQYDALNNPLFLHRNTIKMGKAPKSRERQWYAYQEFKPDRVRKNYAIMAWGELTSCFGEPKGTTEHYVVIDTKESLFEKAEIKLLEYGQIAADMLPESS